MADAAARRLPRGRHSLSREQVEEDQRLRVVLGMAEAMWSSGYVGTPVAEIIKRAGVSRETFYRLYDDKLACFLDAFDLVAAILLERMAEATAPTGTDGGPDGDDAPVQRFERVVTTYLELLAEQPAYARLFLVEVNAAGDEAIERRAAVQRGLADELAALFGASEDGGGRVAAQVIVAAISSLVIPPLISDDMDALRAIGPTIIGHVRRLDAAGLLSS